MKTVTLNNGLEMPMVGFGVYKMPDPEQCKKAVLDALKAGYRLIDTAAVYCNEEAVGEAIEESDVKREDIFLTTKIWMQDFGYEPCKKALQTALKKLRTDYIDLVLIHHPQMDCIGAYRALEEACKEGLVKAIGVSNFYPYRLLDFICATDVVPAVNQVELHPYFQQEDALAFMKSQHVQPQAWGPLAQNKFGLMENPVISMIAKAHDKTPAQIILRWNIQRGVCVVVKSTHEERMKQNLNIFDFELSQDEMDAIALLDRKKSFIEDPFDLDFVWKHCTRKIHD